MTQDTQAGAGAQPAPAQQLAAATSTLERLGYTYRGGAEWAPPLGRAPDFNLLDAANDRIAQLEAEGSRLQSSLDAQRMITDRAIRLTKESDAKLSAARAEAKHWRSNHDNVVARLRIFTQRPDIPKELADRLPWYRELVRLQAVEAQAACAAAPLPTVELVGIKDGQETSLGPIAMPPSMHARELLRTHGFGDFENDMSQDAIALAAMQSLIEYCQRYYAAPAALRAAPPAPAAVAAPDLRLTDEQIEQAFISVRDEFMLREVERTDKKLRLAFARAVLHSARAALAAAPALASDTESVLIDGIAYEVPAAVAGELLSLHLDLIAAAPAQAVAVPIELQGVQEAVEQGSGFWRSCTGCHELNEGHDTGPVSKVFGCALGNGCSECGGIGAVWDDLDYGAMAVAMVAPAQAAVVPAEVELPDVEDMAHSAVQEALSFGVNHDVFHRWMRTVMDKTVQALAAGAAQAPEQWIDDPHGIEQGRMLNPEWVRAQEHATQLAGQEFPGGWKKKFADAVYEDLAAADNQDVPLEEYPARILKVLDGVVGPRHPSVVQWRNDAIRQCIAIAYRYCRDPESHGYLKQDLQALISAAPAQAEEDARDALTLEELDQLDRAMEHFVEGEDTDVDWRLLTRAASLGYLECERFTVPPTARAAIDAARAAQGGA